MLYLQPKYVTSSPKYNIMSKKHSIPCYIANGGEHFIVNVPLGQFTRVRIKHLCQDLLKNLGTFETMLVAKATPYNVKVLKALVDILSLDLKPKTARSAANNLLAAHEKNLKPSARELGKEEDLNLVKFAIACGLIGICFLIVAHLNYLEAL